MIGFVGIDCGADGAIVALNGDRVVIHQEIAPVINVAKGKSKKRIPNVQRMVIILRTIVRHSRGPHDLFAVLEKAQPYPREGAVTSFNYGRGYGAWEAALAALDIPYEVIDPKEWQGVILKGVEGADTKARALLKVQRLVPTLQTVLPRCTTAHVGLPDAGCMALFAIHLHNKQRVSAVVPFIPPPPAVVKRVS